MTNSSTNTTSTEGMMLLVLESSETAWLGVLSRDGGFQQAGAPT